MLTLTQALTDDTAGSLALGDDLRVRRLGFGALRFIGPRLWGAPTDPIGARELMRRAVRLG